MRIGLTLPLERAAGAHRALESLATTGAAGPLTHDGCEGSKDGTALPTAAGAL